MENYRKIHENACLKINDTYSKNLYNLLIHKNIYTTEKLFKCTNARYTKIWYALNLYFLTSQSINLNK